MIQHDWEPWFATRRAMHALDRHLRASPLPTTGDTRVRYDWRGNTLYAMVLAMPDTIRVDVRIGAP